MWDIISKNISSKYLWTNSSKKNCNQVHEFVNFVASYISEVTTKQRLCHFLESYFLNRERWRLFSAIIFEFVYVTATMRTRTHIHTYIIYIRTYFRTYIYTYIHMYFRTYIHTYTYTYIHAYMHLSIHPSIHTYVTLELQGYSEQ